MFNLGSACELVFCSCSSILDPRQVDSLMILVASFPLLGSFGFGDFVEAGEFAVLVDL